MGIVSLRQSQLGKGVRESFLEEVVPRLRREGRERISPSAADLRWPQAECARGEDCTLGRILGAASTNKISITTKDNAAEDELGGHLLHLSGQLNDV